MSTEDHANVPVLPPVLFATAVAVAYALRALVPFHLVPLALEPRATVAGSALAVVGAALGAWALGTFFRERTTPHPNHSVSTLVTHGPYRLSRNPMYVGASVALVGVALIANTGWLLAVLPPLWLLLRRLVIEREEAYLERKFGEEYRAFAARTRRWL